MKFRLFVFVLFLLFGNFFGNLYSKENVATEAKITNQPQKVAVVKDNSEMKSVMWIVMVTWFGVFLFLLKLQMDVRRLRRDLED